MVPGEAKYKKAFSYKQPSVASLDHCAGERGKSQDRPTCSTMDALTNCEIIKNKYMPGSSEICSNGEIKLQIGEFYFTWTPPNNKVILNLKPLYDSNSPKNSLLFRLAPKLWLPLHRKWMDFSDLPNAIGGGRKRTRRRKRKRRRKTKRKTKRKSKRKTKRKSKRRRKRKSKRRR